MNNKNIKPMRHGAARLLLVFALTISMVFSYTSVIFADETLDSNGGSADATKQSTESEQGQNQDGFNSENSSETDATKSQENSSINSDSNSALETLSTTKTTTSGLQIKDTQTKNVVTVSSFAELQSAINNIVSNSTTEIIIDKNIEITTSLTISASSVNVTIKGATGNETLTRTSGVAMFSITAGTVFFEGITLDGGSLPMRLISCAGASTDVTLGNGCTVKNVGGSLTTPSEEAIFINSGCHFTVDKGALVTNNFTNYGALWIRNDNTRVDIKGKLTNNYNNGKLQNGGAIMVYNGIVVLYDGCELSGNKSYYGTDGGAGGAINISYSYIYGSKPGRLIMYGGTIKNNEADADTTITKKYAKDAGGGGVSVCRGVFIMYGGTITGNTASFGGGVSVNNDGSAGDYAGYFIGIGGTISGNTAWSEETILGDSSNPVPITNNSPDISAQAWGKAIVTSGITQTSGSTRTGLPFKSDINVDVVKSPKGIDIEVRNAHELYVARSKTDEGTALNKAYASLSTSGGVLEGYYQVGFHSTDKNNYTVGRETRWFMGTVDVSNFKTLTEQNENNITTTISYISELDSTSDHNTTHCAPKSDTPDPVTIRINYPDYTKSSTHDYRVLYIPYNKVDGTAGEPQVLIPDEKADGLYVTVTGGCFGAFEIEKKGKPATIIFNNNGGSGTMTNQIITNVIDYDNTKQDPNSITGATLKANTFTPPTSNYEFGGWSTKPYGLVGKDYVDEDTIIPNAGDKITLYAKWVPKVTPTGDPATITYHANFTGSDPESYDQGIPAGEETALWDNYFVRSGYEVTSWNTSADGTGTSYTLNQQITLGDGEHLILYAQWEKVKPTSKPSKTGTAGTVTPVSDTSSSTGDSNGLTTLALFLLAASSLYGGIALKSKKRKRD